MFKYEFPAIFTHDNDGISIEFPDLPGCLSCAYTTDEAIKMAKEVLELHLCGIKKDNDKIPKCTSIDNISLLKNQISMIIEVYIK